ncbi:DUF1127 domain-containing protein [Limobrevibacterium gyesilva]|uniref:DUF1127 domain-containing protein n=1 Tax=Limobrevibacterium gyesilva TaxID=2991712 RepID=A0AA42CE78_9PROT|nr:DUF1127 domain-containing protein [Limobrevibacterium gyesilva]MCW3473161.1 DUF1127 domain-containing protein [Limobrevibacterium gyesilva]
MSVIGTFFPHARIAGGVAEGVRGALERGWAMLRIWIRVLSTRRDLAEMDDRMLSDLGISRAQADFELSQTPWTLTRRRRR